MFFCFDGIDGVGKSTQMQAFCAWLASVGKEVVTCRDPGGTPLGERVRELLLNPDNDLTICDRSEMLLYMASRAQLVDAVIEPALQDGKTVVSDRYLLANIAYQGYAGGLDVETVRQIGAVATAGTMPDCIFLLDMPIDAARQRLRRDLDRMEQRSAHYFQRLRDGFLIEAARDPARIHIVDAGQPIADVSHAIQQIAAAHL